VCTVHVRRCVCVCVCEGGGEVRVVWCGVNALYFLSLHSLFLFPFHLLLLLFLLFTVRFLFGLSIRHVGLETAKDISAHFGTFEALWSYLLGEVEKKEVRKVEKEAENEEEMKRKAHLQAMDGIESRGIDELSGDHGGKVGEAGGGGGVGGEVVSEGEGGGVVEGNGKKKSKRKVKAGAVGGESVTNTETETLPSAPAPTPIPVPVPVESIGAELLLLPGE
jgi:hypothetical protein